MKEKYDLNAMLKEIEAEKSELGLSDRKKVSQSDILNLFNASKKKGGSQNNNQQNNNQQNNVLQSNSLEERDDCEK